MKIKKNLSKLLAAILICIVIWSSTDGFTIIYVDEAGYDSQIAPLHDMNASTDVGKHISK